MNTPSPLQAQVLWLYATGMTPRQIAAGLGHTNGTINQALVAARKKATAAGLRIVANKPPEPASTKESGFSLLKRLAAEAGLTQPTPTK